MARLQFASSVAGARVGGFVGYAYSEFKPIDGAATKAAHRRNRRIEISVVLRDASVRAVIDGYMRKLDPRLLRAPRAVTAVP
jgi:hypothetical protein